jgi:hypothetical protein
VGSQPGPDSSPLDHGNGCRRARRNTHAASCAALAIQRWEGNAVQNGHKADRTHITYFATHTTLHFFDRQTIYANCCAPGPGQLVCIAGQGLRCASFRATATGCAAGLRKPDLGKRSITFEKNTFGARRDTGVAAGAQRDKLRLTHRPRRPWRSLLHWSQRTAPQETSALMIHACLQYVVQASACVWINYGF